MQIADVAKGATAPAANNRVAVVGTGVVGLAVALGCAQRGIAVTLVGPAPRRFLAEAGGALFDPRIYAISPAASALLEAQRIWAEVDPARTCAVARMQIWGDDGAELRFEARAAHVESLATICEETQMAQALWLACRMQPQVEHRSAKFVAAQFAADGVRVALDDGSELPCKLLIGADGKHSAVRAAAGISSTCTPYGHTALVANFSCERPHGRCARQWFTDEGVVALLPLPGERVSLVWSAPPALAAQLQALDGAAFALRVAARTAHVLGGLQLLGERHAFVLEELVVERLAQPGLALMGDAAHVVHPLAGQGLNLGLQDVSEFLRLLDAREPWRELGDPVWLRRYERARAEPIWLMRTTVGGLKRLFAAPQEPARRLRNLGLAGVNALAPLKNALIRHAIGV